MLNKTKNYIFTCLLLVFVFAVYNISGFAQGTCPITTLNVDKIKGKVVSQGDLEEPITATKVELFERIPGEEEPLIKSTTTDDQGFFEMRDVKSGKYRLVTWFTVNGETYLKYHVILQVGKIKRNPENEPTVFLRLGMDCFNSEAKLIYEKPESVNASTVKPETSPTPQLLLSSQINNRTRGKLVGTAIVVKTPGRAFVKEAAGVEIRLRFNGKSKIIKTGIRGDYILTLPAGRYCLSSAIARDGEIVRFSPRESGCFRIESNKATRFDIMLLQKPPGTSFTAVKARQ